MSRALLGLALLALGSVLIGCNAQVPPKQNEQPDIFSVVPLTNEDIARINELYVHDNALTPLRMVTEVQLLADKYKVDLATAAKAVDTAVYVNCSEDQCRITYR